jgi:hypothetical protein
MSYPVTDAGVTDEDAANTLANHHPKCRPSSAQNIGPWPQVTSGAGEAPGANGPPTTGAVGPGGPMSAA